MSIEEGRPDDPLVEPLTRRESEILGLLDQGLSAPEMAEQLTLAVSSVKWHIRHLYEKLGVNGKRPALNRARALGLLGGEGVPLNAPTEAPAAADLAELAQEPAPGESPFKGLRHFDEADEALFFGREALAARLAARLTGGGANGKPPTRFLAVVGASGSGKSSIVRAGVIPALRHAQGALFAPIHLLTPTAHPLEALAISLTRQSESITATATLMDDLARDERALHLYARRLYPAPAPRRLLLVVDQFEELFTLCRGEPERQAFINNLLRATAPESDGTIAVLITLRADFYPHCAAYAGLRAALADQQEYIGPMSAAELRQAVERPAALGGWNFEPGLVDLILRDVSDEPGALPLLSHALLETWRHRRGRTLTLHSYAAAGRVQGAIAMTAENVYQSMSPEAQTSARSIFLRLTELGEGTQDTRRRVPLKELLPGDPADGASGTIAGVLQTLSEARLITQDEGVVEVAHEALIREWPTLRQWLSENRDGLRLHRRLTEAAQEWESLERDPSELYRGPRLAQAVEWAEWSAHGAEMNALEREFVQASQALAEREVTEREAQQQRELAAAQALAAAQSQQAEAQRLRAEAETRRAAEQTQAAVRLRGRNRVLAAVGVLALLAAIAAGFFGVESNRNVGLAQVANTQSAQNLSAAQAASTQAIADRDEAQKQAGFAYANQLAAQAILLSATNYPLAALLAAQADRTGSSFLTRTTLHNILTASPHLLGFLYGHADRVNAVAFQPDGKILASGSQDGTVRLWDPATHQPAGAPISVGSPVFSLAFSPDGHTLAMGAADGKVRLWDIAASQWRGEPLSGPVGSVHTLAFSPDGAQLAAGSETNQVNLWNTATGQPSGQWQTGQPGYLTGVAFSLDSKTLATGSSQDNTITLWDAATGQPLGAPLTLAAFSNSVAFGPDGKTLAAGNGSNVAVWDLSATPPRQLGLLSGPTADIASVAFSPDGRLLAAASGDGSLRLWNVAPQSLVGAPLTGHIGPVTSVAFSPDGQSLATAGADQTVALWQTSASLLSLAVDDPVARACRLAGRNLSRAEWNQYLTGQPYRKTCDQWPDGN